MMRKRHATPLVLLLAFEVAAIVGLHALGSSAYMQLPAMAEVTAWLRTSTVDEIFAPVVRAIALGVAYWMFVSTTLFALAQISRIPAAIRATSMFTLPSVRRVVDGAVAVSIATTSFVGFGGTAAMAQTADPGVESIYAQTDLSLGTESVGSPRPGGAAANEQDPSDVTSPEASPEDSTTTSSTTSSTTSTTAEPTTTTTEAPTSTTAAPSSTMPVSPGAGDSAVSSPRPGAPAASTTTSPPTTQAPAPEPETEVAGVQEHRVVAGDNLWTISRDALAEATNRSAGDLTDAEIRDYWLTVIEANRDSIRSGDPHWIFPGEVISLPEINTAS
jgi:hypothetical protein